MSKALKNNTGSDIIIGDTGQTVPASGELAINATDSLLYAASTDVVTPINDGDLIVKFKTTELSAVQGLCYLRTGLEGLALSHCYDNTESGLSAIDVQAAIDEIASGAAVLPDFVLTDDLSHIWTDDLCPVIVG